MADYDVVLLPTYSQVEEYRRNAADAACTGLLSCTVSTFPDWIADLWELWGDGRALVDAVTRLVLIDAALAQASGQGESSDLSADAPGMAPLAARLVRDAGGVPAFEEAVRAALAGDALQQLAPAEAQLLAVCGRYFRLADEMGLVELGQACALLARRADEAFPREVRVLRAQAAPPSWQEQAFFAACPQLNVDEQLAAGMQGIAPAPPGVQVRFALPAGDYAAPALVVQAVDEAVSARQMPVAVSCVDPYETYCRIERALVDRGLMVAVRARVRFAGTDFGRAYLSMVRVAAQERLDADALSDVLSSPFSGYAPAQAYDLAAQLRADRIADKEAYLQQLRAQSELFSQLEELAADPEADILLGVFEQLVQARADRPEPWRRLQLQAMAALRSVTAAARRSGMPIEACAAVLGQVSIAVAMEAGPGAGSGSPADVTVLAQADAASLPCGSVGTLVAADLTAEAYPVADKDDAATVLLEKLGLCATEPALSRARRAFQALVGVPSSSLVLMRPLNDENAETAYPCAVLEEFLDVYRSGSDDSDGAPRDDSPAWFAHDAAARGEELLFANARAERVGFRQQAGALVPEQPCGSMDDDARPLALLPRRLGPGGPARLCPSPSQIESYLECPYKWFAERRLRIAGLDEEFGALQKGSFAHAAFERFYRTFQSQVALKVTPGTLPAARAIMRAVVDELVSEQRLAEPGSGRLVAATQLERRELAAFGDQLVGFLDYEAQLLPTFHPEYFELSFDADRAVDYAGVQVVGTVDRIDVDGAGNAVVIDYKGSVGDEHAIAGKDRAHAGKVQTRIYAQVVRRELGLNVVGCLYVSYGARPQVVGAFDPRVLDVAHLPRMRADSSSCGLVEQLAWASEDPAGDDVGELGARTFADFMFPAMLDATEDLVGQAIARMEQGKVEPAPASSSSCTWCPVAACDKRAV